MSALENIFSANKTKTGSSLSKSQLEKKLKEANLFNEVLLTLIKTTDMDSTLSAILDLAIKITHSEVGGVLLTDRFTSDNQIMLLRGELTEGQFQRILDKANFIRKPAASRQIVYITSNSEGFNEMVKADPALLSVISVPMIVERKTVGILVLMHRYTEKEDHLGDYSAQDIRTVSVFADQAALVLHNTLLKIENGKKEVYLETIAALVSAIDAKDHYTRNHSKNVASVAVILSELLKLSCQEIQTIEYGALLHDIGKIGINEAILNKKGRLIYEEFEIIKNHPVIGVNILQPVDFLQSIHAIVQSHHERIDGKGYPNGLKGEDIPFEARIVSIADAWDAMTSDRSYRKGMPMEKAIYELQEYAGDQFDAYMVRVLAKMFKQNPSLFVSLHHYEINPKPEFIMGGWLC
ncbi:metal dependent phosphohydrolase [Desulfofarcimen acetoxidans DSM 771]|uniref:Metal dependent phosphohydrolase n=1 Tax=Desulfofarcimen acetoxidans (strain ATCC 49208 / DSM 771 / KCTC 5769 / VKM B-1644 / 5575) TaxID=485916 RepID=C8VWG4_DESAS|nr:HD domain-containing phosphohydrolase [Desulfofarcimen acetoxidans]ACV62516.1 metal dependent phosphohydrolase [Desulfofarcimen acetoxidans DSM 771]